MTALEDSASLGGIELTACATTAVAVLLLVLFDYSPAVGADSLTLPTPDFQNDSRVFVGGESGR